MARPLGHDGHLERRDLGCLLTKTMFFPSERGCASQPTLETMQRAVRDSPSQSSTSHSLISRCMRMSQNPPSLEDFVNDDDDQTYGQTLGLAKLINQAEVRLINQTSSLSTLYGALGGLDLANDDRLRPNWDQYFMRLASLAAQRSNCMKRRVGCVLVREKRVISTGYNGTPRYLKNCNEGGCESDGLLYILYCSWKLGARCNSGHGAGASLSTCLCIHAEENALLEAGRDRIREASILYCDT